METVTDVGCLHFSPEEYESNRKKKLVPKEVIVYLHPKVDKQGSLLLAKKKKGKRGGGERLGRLELGLKPFDYYLDAVISQSVSSAATIVYLSAIGQGDDDNCRSGNAVRLNSIDFRWSCVVADTTNIIRLLILSDKQCYGAAPVEGDIFETSANPLSPINSRTHTRFRVIYDHQLCLGTNSDQIRIGRHNKSCHIDISYISTTTAIGSAGLGSLFLVMQSDSGAASHPSVVGYVHLTFNDRPE